MSRKILIDEDHALNQIKNVVIDKQATDPTGVAGQFYFNTTSGILKYYDGTNWQTVADTAGGGGTVTSVSVTAANGFDGTVATSTSTPAITIKATATGLLKSNGTAMSAATAGTDYYAPGGTDVAVADGGTGASTLSGVLKGNGTSAVTGSATINDLGSQTADYSANSHKITNVTDPTSAQDAATKAYVDAAAAGIDWKASVRAATTANGTLASAYANGSTIDGVTLATGNRILLKNQTTGSENGIYVVAASGTPTRATDADASAEVTGGLALFVEEGTANADSGWVLTNDGAITVGTTALTFTQFTSLGQVIAGTGLSKSGNTLSIENSGVLTVAHGGTGITSFGTGVATLLGTPSSANLAAAITDETGSGALVFGTSPTLTTPALGTPSAVVLTNATGTAASLTAGKATILATARTINGVSFDGSANITISTTTKATATIGDGSSTSIDVSDGLGTIDKVAIVRDATSGAQVDCDITYASTKTTFIFAVAPASNAYKVVIIG